MADERGRGRAAGRWDGANGPEAFLEEIRCFLAGLRSRISTRRRADRGRASRVHCAWTAMSVLHSTRAAWPRRDRGVLEGVPRDRVARRVGGPPRPRETRRALCGAHHLRELVPAEELGQGLAAAMRALLLDVRDGVWHAREADRDALEQNALETVHDCYHEIHAPSEPVAREQVSQGPPEQHPPMPDG